MAINVPIEPTSRYNLDVRSNKSIKTHLQFHKVIFTHFIVYL